MTKVIGKKINRVKLLDSHDMNIFLHNMHSNLCYMELDDGSSLVPSGERNSAGAFIVLDDNEEIYLTKERENVVKDFKITKIFRNKNGTPCMLIEKDNVEKAVLVTNHEGYRPGKAFLSKNGTLKMVNF